MPFLHETAYVYKRYGHNCLMPGEHTLNAHSIYELELTVRAWNCLTSAGIYNLHRLRAMTDTELLALQRCGPQTVADIREALQAHREDRIADYSASLTGRPRMESHEPTGADVVRVFRQPRRRSV
jgi:DNA-directed RNA polymerase alpha subunit